jgi:hypothetical protein
VHYYSDISEQFRGCAPAASGHAAAPPARTLADFCLGKGCNPWQI